MSINHSLIHELHRYLTTTNQLIRNRVRYLNVNDFHNQANSTRVVKGYMDALAAFEEHNYLVIALIKYGVSKDQIQQCELL